MQSNTEIREHLSKHIKANQYQLIADGLIVAQDCMLAVSYHFHYMHVY